MEIGKIVFGPAESSFHVGTSQKRLSPKESGRIEVSYELFLSLCWAADEFKMAIDSQRRGKVKFPKGDGQFCDYRETKLYQRASAALKIAELALDPSDR